MNNYDAPYEHFVNKYTDWGVSALVNGMRYMSNHELSHSLHDVSTILVSERTVQKLKLIVLGKILEDLVDGYLLPNRFYTNPSELMSLFLDNKHSLKLIHPEEIYEKHINDMF